MSRYLEICRIAAVALAIGLVASPPAARAVGDERVPAEGKKLAEVEDPAKFFSRKAIDEALPILEKATQSSSIPVMIETMESLGGKTVEEVSLDRASHSGRDGVYILLVKQEKKLEVRVSRKFKETVALQAQKEIRDAFIQGMKQGSPDAALHDGVEAIAKVLPVAVKPPIPESEKEHGLPAAYNFEVRKTENSSLIVRNQVRLSLAGAHRILAGAEKKAAEMGLKVNIAVVDDGGHMLSFDRMDGARPASVYTATTKAVTAATYRQETGPLRKPSNEVDVHLNLSLQNAALASGGKLTTLFGGIPVVVEGQVIGGVGVGGGTGEQDAQVAKAGVEAFLADLKSAEGEAKAEAPAASK